MGNASSNVTSGIKKQAEGAASSICYKLVDLKGNVFRHLYSFVMPVYLIIFYYCCWFYVFRRNNPSTGGGLLIELMKKASKTKDFTEVDKTIVEMVEPCLYNKGLGKMVHIAHLVLLRNRGRAKTKLVNLFSLKYITDYFLYSLPPHCTI